jgi:hypothetical protein
MKRYTVKSASQASMPGVGEARLALISEIAECYETYFARPPCRAYLTDWQNRSLEQLTRQRDLWRAVVSPSSFQLTPTTTAPRNRRRKETD